jgi:hypothetical protein
MIVPQDSFIWDKNGKYLDSVTPLLPGGMPAARCCMGNIEAASARKITDGWRKPALSKLHHGFEIN